MTSGHEDLDFGTFSLVHMANVSVAPLAGQTALESDLVTDTLPVGDSCGETVTVERGDNHLAYGG
jgi:hypothetical protein